MPQPSQSNSTLILGSLLGASLLFLITLVGANHFRTTMTTLDGDLRNLRAQADTQDFILADADAVMRKAEWLAVHQPPLRETATASNELLELVRKAASEAVIELGETRLLEPEVESTGTLIGIAIKGTANLERLAKLLHCVQRPELFISTSEFTIKPQAEPANLDFELKLLRHHRPQDKS